MREGPREVDLQDAALPVGGQDNTLLVETLFQRGTAIASACEPLAEQVRAQFRHKD